MKPKRNRLLPILAACLFAGTAGVWHPVCAGAAASAPDRAPAPAVASAVAPAAASAPAASAAPAAAPEPQTEPPDALASLQKLVSGLRDKLEAERAQPVEGNYAAELAAFDAIVANNKGAKPDDLAQVLAVKSDLYGQVFNDYDNAIKTIERIKADYPQTEYGAHADEMLANLKQAQARNLARVALQTGKTFPDFASKGLAGEEVSLARLKGKVVLVDFWATWCPPCVAEMPNLKAAYEKYHGKGFEIVSISLDQSESALRDFIKRNSIPWAQVFDGKGWESPFAEKYGVDMLPTMYLLDAEGKIVGSNLGGMVLEEQLEKLLGK